MTVLRESTYINAAGDNIEKKRLKRNDKKSDNTNVIMQETIFNLQNLK
jgi:hypothetical protein